jgi:hypothetical protein
MKTVRTVARLSGIDLSIRVRFRQDVLRFCSVSSPDSYSNRRSLRIWAWI